MRVLELFAGTHSVGKVARELGFEVVSLDCDMEADIKISLPKRNNKNDFYRFLLAQNYNN